MLAGGAVRLTARVADAHDAVNQTEGSTTGPTAGPVIAMTISARS
jgi:hypothetical protein